MVDVKVYCSQQEHFDTFTDSIYVLLSDVNKCILENV